jgi:threonine dehydrogenase-like Zn-dependent dehydrogenase
MDAAIFKGPKLIDVEKIKLPEPGEGQVLIRLEGCGICGSNLPVWEGREWFNYPFEPGSPGHEGWGIIEKAGEQVSSLKPGDRVAFLSSHAFAEYDIAGQNSVVKIPSSLGEIPFPGEPLGCVMNIFRRSEIKPGDTVAVIGIGFLGALLTALAKNAGAYVIAISRRDFSLETAKEHGADEIIKMDDHRKIIDRVKEVTNGEMCDRVIEAVGTQWPLDLAGDIVKEMGRLIIAGYHQDGIRQVNMQMWNWKGLDVINAHERKEEAYIQGIRDAVNAVDKGIIKPESLYTHRIPLDSIEKGFRLMNERPGGFMKALVMFN